MRDKVTINTKRLDKNAMMPAFMSVGAAGADVCSVECLVLPAGGRALVKTGIALEIPSGYVVQVCPRSGLAAKRGVTVLNAPGICDSDYRGEVKVLLVNSSDAEVSIDIGDRIAQLVVARVPEATYLECSELGPTARGTGGFGSTG